MRTVRCSKFPASLLGVCMAWLVGRSGGRLGSLVQQRVLSMALHVSRSREQVSMLLVSSENNELKVWMCSSTTAQARAPRVWLMKASAKKGWTGGPDPMEVSSSENEGEAAASSSGPPQVVGTPTPAVRTLVDRIYSMDWLPPYKSPPGMWESPQPLEHQNRGYCRYCLLCAKHSTEGHLMSAPHGRMMSAWVAKNRPGIPPRRTACRT